MRRLIYSMGVSLDGYTAGPGGDLEWSAPSEELHRFHNDVARETDVHLNGRRLYETMLYWETAEEQRGLAEYEYEFARIWKATPKIVFSRSLESVEGNATLAERDPVEEVTALKQQPGGDLAVGGAGLASTMIEAGLVDEFRLFVYPVVLGAGTPYFPALESRVDLRLAETRGFPAGVVYLRYEREPANPGARLS
jgi:dihydrofolate reductase